MAKDPKLTDLQSANAALGKKWQILKDAMIKISNGCGMPELVAKKALDEQAAIRGTVI